MARVSSAVRTCSSIAFTPCICGVTNRVPYK
jgi:hypothetical protein